tara:strand:- start:14369 stop:14659 length:291 start_codon:yes stop_codon:yes gene_type:complete
MVDEYNFDKSDIFVDGKSLAFEEFYNIAHYKMFKNKTSAFINDFTSVISDLENQNEIPDYSVEVFTKLSELASVNQSNISTFSFKVHFLYFISQMY